MTRVAASETETSFFERRFTEEPNTGCFLWFGPRRVTGLPYGKFKWRGSTQSAHRVSWALYRGPIPGGLFVLHRCDTPECVNPDHLFLGTHADNMADKCQKNRQSRACTGGASGERNGRSKLSERQIVAIIERAAAGEKLEAIAREYGVSRGLVSMIASRKIWSHVQ